MRIYIPYIEYILNKLIFHNDLIMELSPIYF